MIVNKMISQLKHLKIPMASLGKTKTNEDKQMNLKEVGMPVSNDETKLNEISDIYINNMSEWNNIDNVELKLVELQEQLNRTSNVKTRKQINCLITTYEVQYKSLLLTKSKENNNDSNIPENTYNNPIDVEDKETLNFPDSDTLMSEIETNEEKRNKNKQHGKKEKNDDEKKMRNNGMEESVENESLNNPTSPSKRKTDHQENEQHDTNHKKKKSTYKNVLINVKGNEKGEYISANAIATNNSKEHDVNSNGKEIRIRFQFTGKNDGRVTKQTQIQELLYNMMHCAKMIDIKCMLLPWEINSNEGPLNGNEIKLMTENKLSKYIDIKGTITKFIDGRQYYQNGLRIKTTIQVKEFIHKWNQWKYDKNANSPFNEWKAVKEAEMQNSDTAYPIGYFAGSTEKGLYDTLEEKLKNELGINMELSYQMINQKGMSNHIWKYAREMAEKESSNPHSKLHKNIKFSLAPSGLVVYVSSPSEIKNARRYLTEKYGKLQNKMWPMMPDGSRMRFIPMIQSYIKNKALYNHLYKSLWTQSVSKSGEIYLDINFNDLFTPKQYFQGQTLEWVIHNALSSKKSNIPLYKHIVKKWTKEYSEQKLQVAVSKCMHEEAISFMNTMEDELVKSFGEEVKHHFINKSNEEQTKAAMKIVENYDLDNDLEKYLLEMNEEDEYQNVLIEGMELLGDKISTRSTKESKENDDKETRKQMENEKMTQISEQMTLDKMTVITDIDGTIPLTNNEKRKVTNTLRANKIGTNDIEEWKNKNIDEIRKLQKESKNREYEMMKRIINDIIKNRKENTLNDCENNSLANLISIAEEEEELYKSHNLNEKRKKMKGQKEMRERKGIPHLREEKEGINQ